MSKKGIADQEIKIKDSLLDFVRTHTTNADLSLIDDIVLSYVVAILEDVSSDPVFSVEDFCEMMSAYFPEFESINHATVCQWIFELAAKLRVEEPEEKSVIEISLPEIVPKTKPRQLDNRESFDLPKRVHKLSEMSDGGSTDSSCCDFLDEIDVLQEMFPHVCSIESRRLFSFNFEMTTAARGASETKEESPKQQQEEAPKSFRYTVCQARTSPVERPNTAGDVMATQKQNVKAAIEQQHLQPSSLPEYYQKSMEKNALINPEPEPTEETRINPKNQRQFQVSKTYANAILPLKSVKLANPFPEPVKMMMSRTVSDDEKAEQMLAEARTNRTLNNTTERKSSTFRTFSTEIKRWYSKTVGRDPKKCIKLGKGQKSCPKLRVDGCPAPARTRCDRLAKNINCKKQEAPYPAYSEFCHEELEEKPSSCKMCPWKPEENPNFKPQKSRIHTSSAPLMVRRSGLEMDSTLSEDPTGLLCDLRKPPCERPKSRRCPPKERKIAPERKKPKPKEEKCDAVLNIEEIADAAGVSLAEAAEGVSLKEKPADDQGPCKFRKFRFPACKKIRREEQGVGCPPKKRKPKVRDCPPCGKTCEGLEELEEYSLSGGSRDPKERKCPKIDMTVMRDDTDDDPCRLRRKGTTKICPADLLKKRKRRPRKKTSGVITPAEPKIEPPRPVKTV